MLFHYNGHGVPRATANGEIWVFNKVSWSIFELKNAFNYWWLVNFIIYSCPCNPFCDNLFSFFFPFRATLNIFHYQCMTYRRGWEALQSLSMIVTMLDL